MTKKEQVARAIFKSMNGKEAADEFWQSDWSRATFYRGAAEAAIIAMREPTKAMMKTGGETIRVAAMEEGYADYFDEAEMSWNAMVDAALKESELA